jgi:hypothetical protein
MADEQTMERIAKDAEQRAQELLDRAREGLAQAEKALAEVATSPVFGNGLAKGLRDQHETVKSVDSNCQNLKVLISRLFRGEDL